MKTKLIMLCTAVSAAAFLHAQSGTSKQEDVQAIQKRTLIVVTEEANEKLLSKLEGDQLAQYKKDIEDYNRDIKDAVTGFWKFNDKIEYKTRAEVDKLTKAKNKTNAYIEYNKFTVNCANAAAYKSTYQFREGTKEITAIGGDYICSDLNIRLCDENPLGPPVYGVHLANPFPNKADLACALKSIQLQLGYKLDGKKDIPIFNMYKENAKALTGLTLLVNENNTDLKIEDIKKVYSSPVELVKKDKIDEAILNSDEKTAFVIVIPTSGSSFSFEIFSAKDGKVLGYTNDTQSTGVKVGGLVGGTAGAAIDLNKEMTKMKVKKDHFKIFEKQVK
ncbi:MAG: hypothetical protein HY841_13180 [Bacteroidetes bacterium]|nr:hypothetical protein [Bacteroidota bacterium]